MRLVLLLVLIAGCAHAPGHHNHGARANHHMHKKSHAELIKAFDDPARDEWQRPQEVLRLMGDLKGKKVIDIGSGSGYFSFKFHKVQALVTAADVDEKFLAHIRQQADAPATRKIEFTDPVMAAGEFDVAFNCNTYHHIDGRVAYFSKVRQGLSAQGKLVIVDFKLPVPAGKRIGPRASMRIPVETVVAELKEAGFQRFEVHHTLPLQYVVVAFAN